MTLAIPARPTTYNGISMRSRLEATYAAFFDRLGLTWQYEPNAFASRSGQYLPDFLVRNGGPWGNDLYVEVKPLARIRDAAHVEEIITKMMIIVQSRPDVSLALLTSNNSRTTTWLYPVDHSWARGGWGICSCGRPTTYVQVANVVPFHICTSCEANEVVAFVEPLRQ